MMDSTRNAVRFEFFRRCAEYILRRKARSTNTMTIIGIMVTNTISVSAGLKESMNTVTTTSFTM